MINGAAPATRESLLVAAPSRTNVSLWTLRSGFALFFFPIYLRQSYEGVYSALRRSKERLKGRATEGDVCTQANSALQK